MSSEDQANRSQHNAIHLATELKGLLHRDCNWVRFSADYAEGPVSVKYRDRKKEITSEIAAALRDEMRAEPDAKRRAAVVREELFLG